MTDVEFEVCEAASNLFLDTETRWSIPYIAFKARESQLPWSQIDSLFQQRLVPVLVSNLYDIAGDWAGFPSDWLASALQSPPARHQPIPPGLLNQWRCLRDFFEWNQLPQHWRTFQALAHLLFEHPWRLNSHLEHLVGQPWSELDGLCQQVFRPRFEAIRLDCDATPQQFDDQWNWLRTFHLWLRRQPAFAWEVCRQLESVFTLPDLARVPKGPMVLESICHYSPQWIYQCLEGPLAQLYPENPWRTSNLAFVLNRRA